MGQKYVILCIENSEQHLKTKIYLYLLAVIKVLKLKLLSESAVCVWFGFFFAEVLND